MKTICRHKSHWRRVIMHLLHDHITNPAIHTVQATLMSLLLRCVVVRRFSAECSIMWSSDHQLHLPLHVHVCELLLLSHRRICKDCAALSWQIRQHCSYSFTSHCDRRMYTRSRRGTALYYSIWVSLGGLVVVLMHRPQTRLIWINPISSFDP